MRSTIREQPGLLPEWSTERGARELQKASELLDEHPELDGLVYLDLTVGVDPTTGGDGLTARQVLRIALLKRMRKLSYRELEFTLSDSRSARTFCQLGLDKPSPRKTALRDNVARIQAETWELINCVLIRHAKQAGVEKGDRVRGDCTVVESNIHAPSDSSLLWDVVRVLTRTMEQAKERFGGGFAVKLAKKAKRLHTLLFYARTKEERPPAYRKLIAKTEEVMEEAIGVAEQIKGRRDSTKLRDQIARFVELGGRVIAQATRRVLLGEQVPASEKIVSVFESHTDVIVKSWRETLFGHKVSLTAGKSGLVLDCVIEDGNPADSTLPVRMIDRVARVLGLVPRQAAFDGAFASADNLAELKARGVEDVCFSKHPGISVEDMTRSRRTFRRLRRFRAGVEATISRLKRCFELSRCNWQGEGGFKSYVWSGVVAANLQTLTRALL